MQNSGLDEAQARLKISGRNINNFRYADDTLMAESKEEIKSLLMSLKEESEKNGIKLNKTKQKPKIMAPGPITSQLIEGENVEIVTYSTCSSCFNNFQMLKLIFKKAEEPAEEPKIKLLTSAGSFKKQESSRK